MVLPLLLLGIFVAFLVAALHLPVPLPIGAMYWDLALYLDAAQRIASGQVPNIDFSTPVGPLGYYLYFLAEMQIPQAHPLLIAQWTPLAITAPMMALLLIEIAPRSRATAWAILLPFLLFSALPFNLVEYFPYPGVDGFGIYNRQTAHILYVLVAALIFMRNPFLLAIVIGLALTALFLFKITGFLAGGLMLAHAILAGRIRWSVLLGLLVIFYGLVGWAEYSTGIISAYLQDIILLVQSNTDSIVGRFFTAISMEFRVAAAAALLVAAILWFGRNRFSHIYSENMTYLGRRRAIHAIFNAPAAWITSITLACIFYETQNTGSQGFIALWPAVWLVLYHLDAYQGRRRLVIGALCAAVALPSLANMVHRAARTLASAPTYVTLQHEHLGPLGLVSIKPDLLRHADALAEHQVRHHRAYMALAEAGELPSFLLYSEPSFQFNWLRELDRLSGAVLAWEAETGRRLTTVYSADFANPLAWLLDRESPPFAQIGADVSRTFRRNRTGLMDALQATDAIFLPRCPETSARLDFRARLMPALEGRQAIDITPCYTMMLKRQSGDAGSEGQI